MRPGYCMECGIEFCRVSETHTVVNCLNNLRAERDDYKRKMQHEHIVAENYINLSQKYKLALEEICKPTYGTELCNTDEENNEILARHYSIYRGIAREALEDRKQE